MVDADVIIRGEKGIFDLTRWFASQANEQFEIAAITVAVLSERIAARSHSLFRRFGRGFQPQVLHHHLQVFPGFLLLAGVAQQIGWMVGDGEL
jgi:hypothetical protein